MSFRKPHPLACAAAALLVVGGFDAYVETFTEDGVLEFSRSTSKGRAEIKKVVAVFKESIGKLYKDKEGNPATLRHVLAS